MLQPRARISINATPKDVFRVLKDFKNYQHWNPWLIIDGNAIEGEVIQIKPRRLTFWTSQHYKVEKVHGSERLIWQEVSWFSSIISTRREHLVYTKADGSAIYTTRLNFHGILSTIAGCFYGKTFYKKLKTEALALKLFCEARYPLPQAVTAERSTLKTYTQKDQ